MLNSLSSIFGKGQYENMRSVEVRLIESNGKGGSFVAAKFGKEIQDAFAQAVFLIQQIVRV